MLSIGEIAHSTGVSRRMLRHWESQGLLAPASIEPETGYRRYRESQLGRVRAIAELRALGFGLSEIGRLLDPNIAQLTLETLLREQVNALQEQISEASTRLLRIQHRLDVIQRQSKEIIMNLSITALPSLEIWGLSIAVGDETEIGRAVRELRQQLSLNDQAVVQLYDGTSHDQITVSVGAEAAVESESVTKIVAPEVAEGVSVTFEEPPESIADAWVLIDAELEQRGLVTFGLYRQMSELTGRVILQAPVRERA